MLECIFDESLLTMPDCKYDGTIVVTVIVDVAGIAAFQCGTYIWIVDLSYFVVVDFNVNVVRCIHIISLYLYRL